MSTMLKKNSGMDVVFGDKLVNMRVEREGKLTLVLLTFISESRFCIPFQRCISSLVKSDDGLYSLEELSNESQIILRCELFCLMTANQNGFPLWMAEDPYVKIIGAITEEIWQYCDIIAANRWDPENGTISEGGYFIPHSVYEKPNQFFTGYLCGIKELGPEIQRAKGPVYQNQH